MIKRYKTRIHVNNGNPIEKHAGNFIFWNDFQKEGIDFNVTQRTFRVCTSDSTDLSMLVDITFDQAYVDRYSNLFHGVILVIEGELYYINSLTVGKITLNRPLPTAINEVTVYYKEVTSIINKATGAYSNKNDVRVSTYLVNNEIYGRKGFTVRANSQNLHTFLYAIPSHFSTITKFTFITDQSADWRVSPGGDSGNAGIPIGKNSVGSTTSGDRVTLTNISWDSQNTDKYNKLNAPVIMENTYAQQKFATKVVEKDSSGYRFYWMNKKYNINSTDQGTIIDRSLHPYIYWSFYQFNGNPSGRFQELSYMFILGNADTLDEKELNRFLSYLRINYDL